MLYQTLLPASATAQKGEVLRLRVRDLSPDRQCLFVKDGKSGKDRYSFYPPSARPLVNAYKQKYKPRYWLFEGRPVTSTAKRASR